MCPSRPDAEDPRARYGLEPDPPEEVARLRELVPGADEFHRVPLHPSQADRCFGEGSDDEDGDA